MREIGASHLKKVSNPEYRSDLNPARVAEATFQRRDTGFVNVQEMADSISVDSHWPEGNEGEDQSHRDQKRG
jgi:hypothetical protein